VLHQHRAKGEIKIEDDRAPAGRKARSACLIPPVRPVRIRRDRTYEGYCRPICAKFRYSLLERLFAQIINGQISLSTELAYVAIFLLGLISFLAN
jgi:hypothetical protein